MTLNRAAHLDDILGHPGPSGGRFGIDFGLILGCFFGSQLEKLILRKSCSRLHGSMIFEVPGGPKTTQKELPKQLPAATWLQEGLGRASGSILEHFRLHCGSPNRLKSVPKSKLEFEAILETKKGNMPWRGAFRRRQGAGPRGEGI